MHRAQKSRVPPGFGQSLLQFAVLIGITVYAFCFNVVKHNPDHLHDLKPILGFGVVILVVSFIFTRATGKVRPFLLLLLCLMALGLGGLTIYLQHLSLRLKAPFSELLIASGAAIIVSLVGSWLGLLLFQRTARKSGVVHPDSEPSSSGAPGIEWLSYNRKLDTVNHGTVDLAEAKRIVDRYIKQAKPHYENGEDAMVETSFQFCQSADTFLHIDIIGPDQISVELQVERGDVPSLLRLFRGHFSRELTLTSRDELLSLVQVFFEITPEDFMPRLSQWSAGRSSG